MKVQVIDISTGHPQEVGRIKFRVLPRRGDLVMFRIGTVKGVFEVDAVIHKIDLGDQEIALRVRQHAVSARQPPPGRRQQAQQAQQAQQVQALPPARQAPTNPQFPEADGDLYYQG